MTQPTFGAAAVVRNSDLSADFNASTDKLTIADNNAWSAVGGGKLTIEAWITPDVLAGPDAFDIINKGVGGSPQNEWDVWVNITAGGVATVAITAYFSATRLSYVLHPKTLAVGGKYHIVAIIDSAVATNVAGYLTLWVNAVKHQPTPTTQGTTPFTPTAGAEPVVIGNFTGSNAFPGKIDDVAIYDYALSDARVLDHYLAGIVTGTATITGAGTFAATGKTTHKTTAAVAGTGTFNADGTVTGGGADITGTATIDGAGAFAATGVVTKTTTAAITGSGTFAATGTRTTFGTATITGTGTFAATGVVTKFGTATIVGTGLFEADGDVETPVAVDDTALPDPLETAVTFLDVAASGSRTVLVSPLLLTVEILSADFLVVSTITPDTLEIAVSFTATIGTASHIATPAYLVLPVDFLAPNLVADAVAFPDPVPVPVEFPPATVEGNTATPDPILIGTTFPPVTILIPTKPGARGVVTRRHLTRTVMFDIPIELVATATIEHDWSFEEEELMLLLMAGV